MLFIYFSSLIGFTSIIGGYIWLKNYAWKGIVSSQEMQKNGGLVLNIVALPDKFYEVYDIIRPTKRKVSMTEQLWYQLVNPHLNYDCRCDDIGYIAWNNDNIQFDINTTSLFKWGGYWKFGFGLEKYSNPEKCFDFWINNDIRWEGKYLISLNELSIKTIHKPIDVLEIDEIIQLIAWHDTLQRWGRNDEKYFEMRYKLLKIMYDKNKPLEEE